MAVSSEPRMELLPDEWQALADLERAARELDRLYSPVQARAIERPLTRMRAALARLEVVRGRGSESHAGEVVGEREERLEAALVAIVEHEEHFGSGPPDDEMRDIAKRALGRSDG